MNYPSVTESHLVKKLTQLPQGTICRHWVIRDDNGQHYHGIVSLSSGPVVIELKWKPTAAGPEQLIGLYQLNLPELLAADLVRFEDESFPGDRIRLRFVRGAGGVISIQSRADRPALNIGVAKL